MTEASQGPGPNSDEPSIQEQYTALKKVLEQAVRSRNSAGVEEAIRALSTLSTTAQPRSRGQYRAVVGAALTAASLPLWQAKVAGTYPSPDQMHETSNTAAEILRGYQLIPHVKKPYYGSVLNAMAFCLAQRNTAGWLFIPSPIWQHRTSLIGAEVYNASDRPVFLPMDVSTNPFGEASHWYMQLNIGSVLGEAALIDSDSSQPKPEGPPTPEESIVMAEAARLAIVSVFLDGADTTPELSSVLKHAPDVIQQQVEAHLQRF